MPSVGEIVYYVLKDGLPAIGLLVCFDIAKRKLRYPLKWAFVILLVANLAGLTTAWLLKYSGILGAFAT